MRQRWTQSMSRSEPNYLARNETKSVTKEDTKAIKIVQWAFLSRVIVLSVMALISLIAEPYDDSTVLAWMNTTPRSCFNELSNWCWIEQNVLSRALQAFVRWDAIYFWRIAKDGSYGYEQTFAFMPLLPLTVHFIQQIVSSIFGLDNFIGIHIQLTLIGILIVNASFIIACVCLYHLTKVLFHDERLARISSLLFCLSPASAFMSAFYTESPFAALSLAGMLAFSKNRYFLAAFLWSLSSATRANGISYAGFFLYSFLYRTWNEKRRISMIIYHGFVTLFYCILTVTGFAVFQVFAYTQFCPQRPWCSNSIPLLYSFVQSHYWNVGFLRYFEWKQLPNFLLAAPTILICLHGILRYLLSHWERTKTLGLNSSITFVKTDFVTNNALFPFIVLWLVLLLNNIFVAHVQIVTRFMTFMPCLHWHVADLLIHRQVMARYYVLWCLLYGSIGLVLFSLFLPPA